MLAFEHVLFFTDGTQQTLLGSFQDPVLSNPCMACTVV